MRKACPGGTEMIQVVGIYLQFNINEESKINLSDGHSRRYTEYLILSYMEHL